MEKIYLFTGQQGAGTTVSRFHNPTITKTFSQRSFSISRTLSNIKVCLSNHTYQPLIRSPYFPLLQKFHLTYPCPLPLSIHPPPSSCPHNPPFQTHRVLRKPFTNLPLASSINQAAITSPLPNGPFCTNFQTRRFMQQADVTFVF